MINNAGPRITGVRLKPPPKDAHQYFETRASPPQHSHSGRFHARAIYGDLRSSRPRHTEAERLEVRLERRRRRELREFVADTQGIEDRRDTSDSEQSNGEGWGMPVDQRERR